MEECIKLDGSNNTTFYCILLEEAKKAGVVSTKDDSATAYKKFERYVKEKGFDLNKLETSIELVHQLDLYNYFLENHIGSDQKNISKLEKISKKLLKV